MTTRRLFTLSLLLTTLFYACQSPVNEQVLIEKLQLLAEDVMGEKQVSLSWRINAGQTRGLNQEAYRILVASKIELLDQDQADLWDSGKVSAVLNYNQVYGGKSLQVDSVYYAKMMVWTNLGKSPWSESQALVLSESSLAKPEFINRFDVYDLKLGQILNDFKSATQHKYTSYADHIVDMDVSTCWAESYLFDNRLLYLQWMEQALAVYDRDGCLPSAVQQDPLSFFELARMLYVQYNETRHLQGCIPVMEQWLADTWAEYGRENYLIGSNPEGLYLMPAEEFSLDGKSYSTSASLISTAVFYRMCEIMIDFSISLNDRSKTVYYTEWADNLRRAYNTRFFNAEQFYYENNSLTANLLSLSLGLCDASNRSALFRHIEQSIAIDHLGKAACGPIGAGHLYRTLSAYGRSDLTYRLASAPQAMEGDFVVWFFEHLCGLRSLTAGGEQFQLAAVFPPGIYFAQTRMETRRGTISTSWIKTADDFVWQVIVPANTQADIRYPAANSQDVYDDGQAVNQVAGIQVLGVEDENLIMRLQPGDYYFSSKINKMRPPKPSFTK